MEDLVFVHVQTGDNGEEIKLMVNFKYCVQMASNSVKAKRCISESSDSA